MKASIIKRTELPVNSHVIRNGKVAYAIFTGYSEGYQAMVQGSISGRVVRIVRENIENWSDQDLLEVAKSAGYAFDTDASIKVIRKGWKVQ